MNNRPGGWKRRSRPTQVGGADRVDHHPGAGDRRGGSRSRAKREDPAGGLPDVGAQQLRADRDAAAPLITVSTQGAAAQSGGNRIPVTRRDSSMINSLRLTEASARRRAGDGQACDWRDVILALVGCAAIWLVRFELAAPPRRRRAGRQADPGHRRNRRRQDVPIFLHGIGTVQAYNIGRESRAGPTAQIVKVDFQGGPGRQGRAIRCFQIDPRPYQAALAQAASRQAERRSAARGCPGWTSSGTRSSLGPGYQTRQSYDQQKALVGQLQAAIKAIEAQIETASSTSATPISARRSAAGLARGSWISAIWCARPINTALVTIAQLKPIFVSFTLPQDQAHKIREHQAIKHRWRCRLTGDDNKTQLADGQADADRQCDRSGDGHDPPEGDVRQRRRAAVAWRICQRVGWS